MAQTTREAKGEKREGLGVPSRRWDFGNPPPEGKQTAAVVKVLRLRKSTLSLLVCRVVHSDCQEFQWKEDRQRAGSAGEPTAPLQFPLAPAPDCVLLLNESILPAEHKNGLFLQHQKKIGKRKEKRAEVAHLAFWITHHNNERLKMLEQVLRSRKLLAVSKPQRDLPFFSRS